VVRSASAAHVPLTSATALAMKPVARLTRNCSNESPRNALA
jgi:hypothetical protein